MFIAQAIESDLRPVWVLNFEVFAAVNLNNMQIPIPYQIYNAQPLSV